MQNSTQRFFGASPAIKNINLRSRATSSRLTLAELVPRFLSWCEMEHARHPNTVKRITSSLSALTALLPSRLAAALTAADLEKFKSTRLASGIAEVSLRHDLHAISKFAKWAVRHGHAQSNPVEGVSIPSDRDAVRVKVLTQEEETIYFNELCRYISEGHCAPVGASNPDREPLRDQCRLQDLHDLGRLMLCTGARPSELLGLSSEDVEYGKLCIRAGKSRAARRTLALNQEAAQIVARRLQGERDALFPGVTLVSLDKMHKAVCEAAGLDFVLYSLRHSFASRLAESGCPPTVLASILGHSNLACILKYCHTGQDAINNWLTKKKE